MLVVDASFVVAVLVATGADGEWAENLVAEHHLAAPHLMPVEVASILRRAVLAREISEETASFAHEDLLSLRIELFPYAPFASRVWELRSAVTAYDAWYVALAESLEARLATLDLRLRRTSGPRCAFATPPRRS